MSSNSARDQMDDRTGWLIDLYPDPRGGLKLWLLCDSGDRLCLRQHFPVTFYAAGDFTILRQAWIYLQDKDVDLARMRRKDLFIGERDVLAATVRRPAALPDIFKGLSLTCPNLDYYDVDIPLSLRFAAQTGVSLLSRCRVSYTGDTLQSITVLNSPWEIEPEPIPLRILYLSPDVDPAHRPPGRLRVRYARVDYWLHLAPARALLIALDTVLKHFDPDLIITAHGDNWLLPQLREWSKGCGLTFNPNRDQSMEILTRQANSYYAYGQVIYRGAQTHLYGRWHIDRRNALMYNEYDLAGVLEQARVTSLGVQDMARKSPGAGITAMQMHTALRRGVLVPLQKQQAEDSKSLSGLIRADRGGMVYQPLIGLHRNVAQIDFASMYPSIMVNWNISPETLGKENAEEGLVPETLRPLLEKRLALKRLLIELDPRDCRVQAIKERAAALKWLLVVCFGYLGYKNARFGKIESHEAVTAGSRELLLQAKEVAENLGFLVLHMYIDSLFVQKEGAQRAQDFTPLLEAINQKTGIAIALDGVYKWVVFLPSRRDARVPVPNRYFGIFQSGEIKVRGIEARRHDTVPFVRETQLGILEILARASEAERLPEHIPEAQAYIERRLRELRSHKIPLEQLLARQRLSRELATYRTPSPAARAAQQVLAKGQAVAPGQTIAFLFTRGKPGVFAWDNQEDFDQHTLDLERYQALLMRAAETVLQPIRSETHPGTFHLLAKK